MASPAVSFISVNYNQPEVSLAMVASLNRLTFTDWECILVDNGSLPSLLEEALSAHEKVRFIRSEKNLGFAGGNNLAIDQARGQYLYLVNNDTELPPNHLEPILEFALRQKDLGALSPRIIYHQGQGKIQYAGATPLNPLTLRNRYIGQGEIDQGQYNMIRPTAFGHGAALFLPAKVVKEVGKMHADYFLYYEEYDWCARIAKAGYRIFYFGKSHIYHKESVSTGKSSSLKTYYLTRNRLLYARRNHPCLLTLINFLYFSLVALPKNVLGHLWRGENHLARAFWRGYRYHWLHPAKPRELQGDPLDV